MKHYRVTFKPDDKVISIHAGATILEAAAQAGIIMNTTCGGKGTCGKCAVLLEPDSAEVLACRHRIAADLVVTIPRKSRFFQQRILQHGIDAEINLSPCVSKRFIHLESADPQSLATALETTEPDCVHRISSNVEAQLRQGDFATAMTVVMHRTAECPDGKTDKSHYNCLCLEKADTTASLFGVAVDLGTTTIVAKLVDMSNGQNKATAAASNPQITFGDDVVSRISFAHEPSGAAKLHEVVIECINSLIEDLCQSARVDAEFIYELTLAGNTAMSHLFLNFPIAQLGQAPYEAYSVDAHDRRASEMGLNINPYGNIHVIENIAGFIGSDILAGALAAGVDDTDKMTLFVDIGTNGELVLGTADKLYSASCAAGPALEGARITQGSRAIPGAIERIVLNGEDLDLDVIENAAPASICGSGLIDAVAVLLKLGIIDEMGSMVEAEKLKAALPEAILNRVTQVNGQGAFILAHNADNDNDPVMITQKDVRETQLAKGAIRAGIQLLQNKLEIADSQIEQVLLAGAFGNYIRRKSARAIGLLPNVPLERIHFVGNTAGAGAQMVLLSCQCRQLCKSLAEQIQYVEIALDPSFMEVFTEAMLFKLPE